MTPKIDSQLTQTHSSRRSRRPHGPWSTSLTDPHPHMLSRFWKRRIAMLARAPYQRPQSSLFQHLIFASFALAVFALPMLNIVQVQTLLARDDKPILAESDPNEFNSEAQSSELITPEQEEEPKKRPLLGDVEPAAIEEEEISIKKITEAPKTVDPTEKPIGESDDDFKPSVREPDRKGPHRPRPELGGYGGGSGITVNQEEVETNLDKPSPPQPEFIPAPTQQEQVILKKLDEISDFPYDFKEETLQGVVDFLKLRFATPIFIDLVAMEEVGLDRDTPAFDLSISNVDGHSILRLLLGRRQLGYCVEDGVLKITSQENLNSRQRLYIYPLADLVHSREDLDEILDAVENTLRVRGMTGVFSINASTRSLIATHSYVSHQEVLNLLRGLRQVAAITRSHPLAQGSSLNPQVYDESNSHMMKEGGADEKRGGGLRRNRPGDRIGSSTRVIEAPSRGSGHFGPQPTEKPAKTSPNEKPTDNDEGFKSPSTNPEPPTTTVNGKPVPASPGDPK